jgi:glucose/arabinose dehydrogenase
VPRVKVRPKDRTGKGPFTFDTATGQKIKVSLVAEGLVHPFGMVFPDARTILVTERAGRLRVIRDGKLCPRPAWEAPAAARPDRPPSNNAPDLLHFVELHPQFAQNQLVYLSYPKYSREGQHDRGGPRQADWRYARGLQGDLRLGRLGKLRRQPRDACCSCATVRCS